MDQKQIRPAASAFLLMLTMSLLSTALSFFVAPVCADLGFGRGSFTLYYSLMVAAGAVSASFLGAYMNRKGTRGVVLVSAVWCGVGFWGLSFSSAQPRSNANTGSGAFNTASHADTDPHGITEIILDAS